MSTSIQVESRMMSPQYSLLAIVAVALIAGVSEASPPQRIVGGQAAVAGEFPYQAQVTCVGHNCGGVIISRRHVLTAGHCVRNCNTDPFTDLVVLTRTALANEGNNHTVESVTRHPLYRQADGISIHDLAIIALKENMSFDAYQKKVELPIGYTPSGVSANVTGWGRTLHNYGVLPYHLQKATVTTINFSDCDPDTHKKIGDGMFICSIGTLGTSICVGDSGGPLVSNGRLIGIASYRKTPCGLPAPDAYVYVYSYMSWIRRILSST